MSVPTGAWAHPHVGSGVRGGRLHPTPPEPHGSQRVPSCAGLAGLLEDEQRGGAPPEPGQQGPPVPCAPLWAAFAFDPSVEKRAPNHFEWLCAARQVGPQVLCIRLSRRALTTGLCSPGPVVVAAPPRGLSVGGEGHEATGQRRAGRRPGRAVGGGAAARRVGSVFPVRLRLALPTRVTREISDTKDIRCTFQERILLAGLAPAWKPGARSWLEAWPRSS